MHAHSIVPRLNNTPCVRQYEPRTQRVERVSPLLARKRVYKSYKRCTSSFLQSGSRSPLNYRFERVVRFHGFVPIAGDDSLHPSHPRIGIVYRSGVTRSRQTSEFFLIKLIDYIDYFFFCLCVFLEVRYRIISLRFGYFSRYTRSSPAS